MPRKTISPQQLLAEAKTAAIKHYINYSKAVGETAELFVEIGQLHENVDEDFQALDWYWKACDLAPHITEPLIRMSRVYDRMLRHNEARDCAKQALKLDSESEPALLEMCVALNKLQIRSFRMTIEANAGYFSIFGESSTNGKPDGIMPG